MKKVTAALQRQLASERPTLAGRLPRWEMGTSPNAIRVRELRDFVGSLPPTDMVPAAPEAIQLDEVETPEVDMHEGPKLLEENEMRPTKRSSKNGVPWRRRLAGRIVARSRGLYTDDMVRKVSHSIKTFGERPSLAHAARVLHSGLSPTLVAEQLLNKYDSKLGPAAKLLRRAARTPAEVRFSQATLQEILRLMRQDGDPEAVAAGQELVRVVVPTPEEKAMEAEQVAGVSGAMEGLLSAVDATAVPQDSALVLDQLVDTVSAVAEAETAEANAQAAYTPMADAHAAAAEARKELETLQQRGAQARRESAAQGNLSGLAFVAASVDEEVAAQQRLDAEARKYAEAREKYVDANAKAEEANAAAREAVYASEQAAEAAPPVVEDADAELLRIASEPVRTDEERFEATLKPAMDEAILPRAVRAVEAMEMPAQPPSDIKWDESVLENLDQFVRSVKRRAPPAPEPDEPKRKIVEEPEEEPPAMEEEEPIRRGTTRTWSKIESDSDSDAEDEPPPKRRTPPPSPPRVEEPEEEEDPGGVTFEEMSSEPWPPAAERNAERSLEWRWHHMVAGLLAIGKRLGDRHEEKAQAGIGRFLAANRTIAPRVSSDIIKVYEQDPLAFAAMLSKGVTVHPKTPVELIELAAADANKADMRRALGLSQDHDENEERFERQTQRRHEELYKRTRPEGESVRLLAQAAREFYKNRPTSATGSADADDVLRLAAEERLAPNERDDPQSTFFSGYANLLKREWQTVLNSGDASQVSAWVQKAATQPGIPEANRRQLYADARKMAAKKDPSMGRVLQEILVEREMDKMRAQAETRPKVSTLIPRRVASSLGRREKEDVQAYRKAANAIKSPAGLYGFRMLTLENLFKHNKSPQLAKEIAEAMGIPPAVLAAYHERQAQPLEDRLRDRLEDLAVAESAGVGHINSWITDAFDLKDPEPLLAQARARLRASPILDDFRRRLDVIRSINRELPRGSDDYVALQREELGDADNERRMGYKREAAAAERRAVEAETNERQNPRVKIHVGKDGEVDITQGTSEAPPDPSLLRDGMSGTRRREGVNRLRNTLTYQPDSAARKRRLDELAEELRETLQGTELDDTVRAIRELGEEFPEARHFFGDSDEESDESEETDDD